MAISQGTRERLATQLNALRLFLEGPTAAYAEIAPEDGGWSAKENVAHLARHAHVFLGRVDRILREDRPNLGTYRPEQDPEWPAWRALPLDEALLRLRAARATARLGRCRLRERRRTGGRAPTVRRVGHPALARVLSAA